MKKFRGYWIKLEWADLRKNLRVLTDLKVLFCPFLKKVFKLHSFMLKQLIKYIMAITHSIYGGLVQLAGNRVEIEVVNDDVKGESPRALLKATSTDGAVAGGPFIDSREYKAGKAVFDFSESLDAPTDLGFTFPYGDQIAVKHPLRAFDIDILAGASYIDNVEASATVGKKFEEWQNEAASVSMRILKGGMSQDRQAQYNEAGLNFYQDYILGNKFLTRRPDNQRISYNQPVRLWYLLPGTEAVTRQMVVIYQQPGALQVVTTFDMTLEPDGLYEFVLDPAKLQLPEDITSFTVFQADGYTTIGESRTFIIDSKPYENNTFLFFANSLAGIDDAWFTGAVKMGLQMEGETGIQALDRTATTRDRSVVVTSKTGSRKWSIFPGNRLNVEEMEALQDLIYSKHIWLVWNGRTVPVNLENGEFDLTDSMRDLLINDELELVFVEAHRNNHF